MEEKFKQLLILFVALTVLELILILAGVVSDLNSSSTMNTVLSIARLAVIAYTGWIFAGQGLKEVAKKSAIMVCAGFVILIIAILIGIFQDQTIQLDLTWGIAIILTLVILLLANVLVGLVIAVAAAWTSTLINKKKAPEAKPTQAQEQPKVVVKEKAKPVKAKTTKKKARKR